MFLNLLFCLIVFDVCCVWCFFDVFVLFDLFFVFVFFCANTTPHVATLFEKQKTFIHRQYFVRTFLALPSAFSCIVDQCCN